MDHSAVKERLLDVGARFQEARILLTATDLDLFTKLAGSPATVDELASAYGWDRRALRILLDALTAMEFISKSDDGAYSIDGETARYMSRDRERSILPLMKHRSRMWETWSNLTETVKQGRNPDHRNFVERDESEMESFIEAMDVIGKAVAPQVSQPVDASRYGRLLDIGGGSGVYTAAFLRRAPELRATLFDLPTVVEVARRKLTEEGLIDRVDLVAGDYTSDPLPPGHDLVLLSAIIHINDREGNRALFSKIFDAMEPGGSLVIRDYFLDDTRTKPVSGALFAVNMLVATEAGDSHSFRDVKEDLEYAGFTNVELIRDGQRMDQLAAAKRP